MCLDDYTVCVFLCSAALPTNVLKGPIISWGGYTNVRLGLLKEGDELPDVWFIELCSLADSPSYLRKYDWIDYSQSIDSVYFSIMVDNKRVNSSDLPIGILIVAQSLGIWGVDSPSCLGMKSEEYAVKCAQMLSRELDNQFGKDRHSVTTACFARVRG